MLNEFESSGRLGRIWTQQDQSKLPTSRILQGNITEWELGLLSTNMMKYAMLYDDSRLFTAYTVTATLMSKVIPGRQHYTHMHILVGDNAGMGSERDNLPDM